MSVPKSPRPLRILHLFANFKWTGPADPAIRAAVGLRRIGADAMFAQATWTLPGAEHRMRSELERMRMPVTADLELRKHFQPLSLMRDARVLAHRLRRGDFDVLHTHLQADHLIAAVALARVKRPITVVRTLYDPEPPRRELRHRLTFSRTDGVVVPTRACGQQLAKRFGLPAERVLFQEPTVGRRDLSGDRAASRAALGLREGDFAIGIVARVQPHRRFSLLWQTMRALVDAEPTARLVLLGRGNDGDCRRLVTEPVGELGLEDALVWPGYLLEPAYGDALRALDAFLFLVPGSDGTCRAVREAMASGLPVVSTQRGVLPELLDVDSAEPAGIAAEESVAGLSAALLALIRDPRARRRLAEASLQKARVAMDQAASSRRLLRFYHELHGRDR